MEAFAYQAPSSVDEAVQLLSAAKKAGRRAQALAGGTDLLVQIRSADRAPRTIVDLKRIPEVNQISVGASGFVIGAAVKGAELCKHADLIKHYPGLVEAVDLIGSTQIQGRASLGGNLCNSSPAGDTIPALIANAAMCSIHGPNGAREISVEKFVTGVGTNVLTKDEILVALKLPIPAARTGDAYLRFIPRTEMDIAVAGAGANVTLDAQGVCTAARIAIGAVAPTALLVPAAAKALIGSKLDDAALDAAGKACTAASSPISDKRGTADYRRKVVAVLCRRAVKIAHERALRS